MIFDTKGEQLLPTLMNYQIAILSVPRFTETAALLETIQQARTKIHNIGIWPEERGDKGYNLQHILPT
jgi:hypothetical protein